MKNEEILEKRWKNIRMWLQQFKKQYLRINRTTQDTIHRYLRDFDFSYNKLSQPISFTQMDKILRIIQDYEERKIITDDYSKYFIEIVKKTWRMSYLMLLETILLLSYCEERFRLETKEYDLFQETYNEAYHQAEEELRVKEKNYAVEHAYLLSLLLVPSSSGYSWKDWCSQNLKYNVDQMKKQIVISLQQNKKIDLNDVSFQNILKKQQNNYLGDDSGVLDMQVSNIANQGIIDAGRNNNAVQCRFISDMCDHVTMMCEKMNNMIFNIDDWNEFDRYIGNSAKDLKWTRVKVKGLQLGVNLPPINQHFHWCHSTITFLLDIKI